MWACPKGSVLGRRERLFQVKHPVVLFVDINLKDPHNMKEGRLVRTLVQSFEGPEHETLSVWGVHKQFFANIKRRNKC